MTVKYKITIEVEYDPESYPDPSNLLDSFQDEAGDLLSPLGEPVKSFDVCVENLD